MLIATCGTTLVVGKQEWSVLDADGHRIKISKPMCDVDELYSLAQPGVDVHNKLRQKSLAVEKSCGTRVCLFFYFKWPTFYYAERIIAVAYGCAHVSKAPAALIARAD